MIAERRVLVGLGGGWVPRLAGGVVGVAGVKLRCHGPVAAAEARPGLDHAEDLRVAPLPPRGRRFSVSNSVFHARIATQDQCAFVEIVWGPSERPRQNSIGRTERERFGKGGCLKVWRVAGGFELVGGIESAVWDGHLHKIPLDVITMAVAPRPVVQLAAALDLRNVQTEIRAKVLILPLFVLGL